MKDDICVNKSSEIEIDTDVSSSSVHLYLQTTLKEKKCVRARNDMIKEVLWIIICSSDLKKFI